ncbi:CehA/McbA family metallohydrolase [Paenibacillus allorhizosphaerae]|uniref:Polymerase/histidinol phosphatase N-terminal domain-containing protein n=1 Tax=Paenibacillus allorhizosphaerae TaxID=2849866 RepID=A0ABM8VIW9_9BACL|nr:CehA/McbA family metallohydrolase [Paenibacillus allorhizosphaerae]CAG7644609.1 hypothetical protein PAECIP111802_03330 [Paenibacillus allorhizosphaerae]
MNDAQKRWLPFELHTHTFHSDGKQTLLELAEGAKALGFSGVALTDHNTMTGLAGKEHVSRQTGVEIIPGLEWTTFFGHMVTLGIKEYVDWRNLSPFHLHRGIEDVHRQGGLAGVAHPFRVGSPMCTGCFWEFEVSDWRQIDYIEVWSGLFPSIQRINARAFAFWTDLLNRGFRIAATSGRDWHVPGPVSEPVSATFLGLSAAAANPESQPLADAAVDALRHGAASVSVGPLPLLSVRTEDGRELAGIGEAVMIPQGEPRKAVLASLSVDFAARDGQWELQKRTVEFRLNSNRGELAATELSRDRPVATCPIDASGVTWLRGEMYGVMHGVHTMIGFTNPIYFDIH